MVLVAVLRGVRWVCGAPGSGFARERTFSMELFLTGITLFAYTNRRPTSTCHSTPSMYFGELKYPPLNGLRPGGEAHEAVSRAGKRY